MSKRKIVSRWGDPNLDDTQYVTLPGFILRNYKKFTHNGKRVGLSSEEFEVFAHIMAFKFDLEGSHASPSLQTIAEIVDKHVSTVRRIVGRMLDKGAVSVEHRPGNTSIYDFSALVRQCRQFEAERRASTGKDATPSTDASTSTDARGGPSTSARGDLAPALGEDLEGKEEDKTKNDSEPSGSDGAGAKPSRKRSPAQLKLDAMKNALADAFGLDHDKVTGTQWNEFGTAGKDLIKVGATPQDMAPLHAWCIRQGWSSFTSMAMAKNYANFDKERQRGQDKATKSTTAAQNVRVALYATKGGTP